MKPLPAHHDITMLIEREAKMLERRRSKIRSRDSFTSVMPFPVRLQRLYNRNSSKSFNDLESQLAGTFAVIPSEALNA